MMGLLLSTVVTVVIRLAYYLYARRPEAQCEAADSGLVNRTSLMYILTLFVKTVFVRCRSG